MSLETWRAKQFSVAQRLFRRLRPISGLLTFQSIGTEKSVVYKIYTTSRVIAVWPGADIQPWFGTLGSSQINDPQFSCVQWRRSHTADLEHAAWARRLGRYKDARECVKVARRTRLEGRLGYSGS